MQINKQQLIKNLLSSSRKKFEIKLAIQFNAIDAKQVRPKIKFLFLKIIFFFKECPDN